MAFENYRYAHIVNAGTTNLSANNPYDPHTLGKLTINSAAAGSITIYDGPDNSFAVIAIITIAAGFLAPVTAHYNIETTKGLTIVTSANCDLTVSYR